MRVITAPEKYTKKSGDVFCFLAGGITNCKDWQNDVISYLQGMWHVREMAGCKLKKDLVLFNPRRENFPIKDPTASEKQIEWEYKALEACDIFSMFFCAGESDQPICMYELGRNLVRMNEKFGIDAHNVITVEDGYKRAKDVDIQVGLTPYYTDLIVGEPDHERAVDRHAQRIWNAFYEFGIYEEYKDLE